MKRRTFLKLSALAALAAQGNLPLLAANRTSWGGDNRFTEPAAIEPITGFLPNCSPLTGGDMKSDFTAKYKMMRQFGQQNGVSRNEENGSLEMTFAGNTCNSTEIRVKSDSDYNTVHIDLEFQGQYNCAKSWTLESTFFGHPEARLVESGNWDGSTMSVQTKSWTNSYPTGKLLIARYALWPLLASGVLKNAPLVFDMLEDCSLRRAQTLKYAGEIEIPVAGGTAVLDSYAHTGYGSVPTHYLVDKAGRVQLITMQTVNWALTELA